MAETSIAGVEVAAYQPPSRSQQVQPEQQQQRVEPEAQPAPEPRPEGNRGNNIDVTA
jgi:FtsZ-interacting cell division protein ZipA